MTEGREPSGALLCVGGAGASPAALGAAARLPGGTALAVSSLPATSPAPPVCRQGTWGQAGALVAGSPWQMGFTRRAAWPGTRAERLEVPASGRTTGSGWPGAGIAPEGFL